MFTSKEGRKEWVNYQQLTIINSLENKIKYGIFDADSLSKLYPSRLRAKIEIK